MQATDTDGFASPNPLYMSYTPSADGHFNGVHQAPPTAAQQPRAPRLRLQVHCRVRRRVQRHQRGGLPCTPGMPRSYATQRKTPHDFDRVLPTLQSTITTTAILEAGRISLDQHRFVAIHVDPETHRVVLA